MGEFTGLTGRSGFVYFPFICSMLRSLGSYVLNRRQLMSIASGWMQKSRKKKKQIGGRNNGNQRLTRDIDRYKESVVMGLTAKQLIFSVASVVAEEALYFFCTAISD